MCHAFEMAGAAATLVHLDALIADPDQIAGYQLIGFPGGFSYGDDIASGRVFAMRCRERLYPRARPWSGDADHRGVQRLPGAGADRSAAGA